MPETVTKARGIIWRDWQVRAYAEGRLTQFRVPVKQQPTDWPDRVDIRDGYVWTPSLTQLFKPGKTGMAYRCPYKPGDVLFSQEDFYVDHVNYTTGRLPKECPAEVAGDMIYYPADARGDGKWCCQVIPECCCAEVGKPRIRPASTCPAWASRYSLTVTGVKVQRTGDATLKEILAEGTPYDVSKPDGGPFARFNQLWPDLELWTWVVAVEPRPA